MYINIILPYKEKFSKNKASSVSITVYNNLKYSKYKKNVRVYGQYVDNPIFEENFNGVKKSFNFFKSKNKMIADFMCKKIKKSTINNIVEVHNRPYLIRGIKKKLKLTDKLTLFFHNDPLEMKGSKTILQRRKLLQDLDKIYCVSEFIKKRFLVGLSDDHKKVIVLYNGVIRDTKYFPTKKKEVIFVGRIVKDKGVHLFVDAVSNIYNDFKEWKFSIIGSPKLGLNNPDYFSKKIKEKFEDNGNRARMLGFINNNSLNKIMQKSSIIVIPSIWEEPFGLVAAEAMSHGIAIISSDKGGLPEIIGKNGILINNINSKSISKELRKLMSNEKELKKFQKNSWRSFSLESKKVSSILDLERENLFSKN